MGVRVGGGVTGGYVGPGYMTDAKVPCREEEKKLKQRERGEGRKGK